MRAPGPPCSRCSTMANAARSDDKFRFYATAGTLKPPNAAFRNSLGGQGIVVIRAAHFWAASYGKHLTPVVGGSFQLSMRELAYVHLPHLTLSSALSAMPLPWYFELSWLATHLWRLHRVGMVAKEFDSLEALRDYHTMLAEVTEAARAADAKASPLRTRRRGVSFFRPQKRRARGPPQRTRHPVQLLDGCRPRGVHDLRLPVGPRPERMPEAWHLRCVACGLTANTLSRWTALTVTECTPSAGPSQVRLRGCHELVKTGRVWECRRCGLQGDGGRRAKMARTGCAVPEVTLPGGSRGRAVEEALGGQLREQDRWRCWQRGRASRWDAGRPDPCEGAQRPTRRLAAWRPHKVVGSGKRALCLECGEAPTAADGGRLEGTPCPGRKRLRAAAAVRLTTGALDEALNAAPASLKELAREQGWQGPKGPRLC